MLSVENLHKTYEGKPLLSGIDFEVQTGETVCLLGRSGSGKSTILRIIAGIEKPESGSVLWVGENLAGVPVHQRNFGFMFQDYALFPHRNVAENIAFGLEMQNMPRDEIRKKVMAALNQVNMQGFENRRVTDLSGGEQQRVALARALAPQPRLLMLDEPLGALDRTLREQLMQELRALLHDTGIPAIYVTHDQEEAFTIADRLILIKDGLVEQQGSPAEIYCQPQTTWVAGFMGLTNLIKGRVLQVNPLMVETSLGKIKVLDCEKDLRAGLDVQLLLRPGAVRSEQNGGSQIEVDVLDCVFLGGEYRIRVNAGGQEMIFSYDRPLTSGERTTFSLDPHAINCFVEAEDAR